MLRYRGSQIESYMPSRDARASDGPVILDGKNVAWDSKGPKTGFSTRELAHTKLTTALDAEGLRIGPYTLVFSAMQILQWNTGFPKTWKGLYPFTTLITAGNRSPWQGIYLNNKVYLTQRQRGFFSGQMSAAGNLVITQETDVTIPGLIPNAEGLTLVRGRAIIVNNTTIQWSAVGSLATLAPTLGGAGFQAISQFAKGDFLAVQSFEDSFVVWTTEGAIIAEYIGGDATWRFDNFKSNDRPIAKGCTATLIDGNMVFLSKQGLQIMPNANGSQALSPEFNEFLRGYMEDQSSDESIWRIDYDEARQRIFVSEATDGLLYYHSFVLYLTLNRWGIFSDPVCGFLPLTEELFGYVDANGIANYFVNGVNRGTQPEPTLGLSRMRPRMQRQSQSYEKNLSPTPTTVVNSSVVSNPYSQSSQWIPNFVSRPLTPPQYEYWAEIVSPDYRSSGGLKGMDSWMEIGFIRAPEIQETNQGVTEIQQLSVGSLNSMPPLDIDPAKINRNPTFFDYVIHDRNLGGTDEDYNAGTVDIDFQFQLSGLMYLNWQLAIHQSDDGITLDKPEINLSQFYVAVQEYTTTTTRIFNTIRIDAEAVNEYCQVRYLEAKLNYGGENP